MPRIAKPRLADPKAEAWYSSMARRSKITADVNYRRLRAFCEQMGVTPAQVVQRSRRPTEVRDLLSKFVDQEVGKKRSAWYIHSTVIAVKSWLAYNDKPLKLKVELPSNTVSPRREDERVPTVAELRSIVLGAKPHERVVVALMAFGGLRPGAIGSYEGTDGLRLKDLPEIHYNGDGCRAPDPKLHVPGRVVPERIPTKVRVRSSSSKARHQYLTFLGDEGTGYLVQYLEQRLAGGESLAPDADLAHPLNADKRFVRSLNIGARVRRVFKAIGLADAAGNTPRPYVLRQDFLNRCLEAQSKAGIPDRFIEFWAGHRGDVTAQYYTTGLTNLPDSMLEEMRAAYKRCEPFLSTTPIKDATDQVASARELLLRYAGATEEDISKLDLASMTNDEVLAVADKAQAAAPRIRGPSGQKAVPIADVRTLLDADWEYVAPLGLDQAVLRGPATGVRVQ